MQTIPISSHNSTSSVEGNGILESAKSRPKEAWKKGLVGIYSMLSLSTPFRDYWQIVFKRILLTLYSCPRILPLSQPYRFSFVFMLKYVQMILQVCWSAFSIRFFQMRMTVTTLSNIKLWQGILLNKWRVYCTSLEEPYKPSPPLPLAWTARPLFESI